MTSYLARLWRREIEPLLEEVEREECISTEHWTIEKTEGGLVLIYRTSGDERTECSEGETYVEDTIDELVRAIEPGVKFVVNGWAIEKARGDVIVIYRDRRAVTAEEIEEVCKKLREEED